MNKAKTNPPRWSLRLLKLFIRKDFLEEIEGDMEEIYLDEVEEFGYQKARRRYNWQILKLLRPQLLKPFTGAKNLYMTALFAHNLKTASKLILRNKQYSLLNIAGLSMAITCFVFLFSYVRYESTYDRHIEHGEVLYKLIQSNTVNGNANTSGIVPHSMASAFHKTMPEILESAHFAGPFRGMLISYEDAEGRQVNYAEEVVAADSALLDIFDIEMLQGNRKYALSEPVSMVLSESAARKHFGDENPIGRTIHMSRDDFKVTGVFKDLPENSHLKFNILISINTIGRFNFSNFTRPNVNSYFRLAKQSNPGELENKFDRAYRELARSEIEKQHLMSFEDYQAAGNQTHYSLVPLHDVYLHPARISGLRQGGNLIVLRVLMFVALLVVLLAVINFSNLNTTLYTRRSKSVGVKKVMGSRGIHLFSESISESVILCYSGAISAILTIKASSPYFVRLTGKNVHFLSNSIDFLQLFLFTGAIGLIAGLYPALLSAKTKPVSVLKGQLQSGLKGQRFRNSLLVFQFSIAVALVFGVSILGQQIKYLIDKDLGYDQERLMVITGNFHMYPDFVESYMAEARNFSEVQSVAGTLSMPGLGTFWKENYQRTGNSEIKQVQTMKVGDGLAETMDLKLVSGKFFSNERNDSTSVILNESAVKVFGITDPVGQSLSRVNRDGLQQVFRIIGVVEDFNYTDLYTETGPLLIQSNEIIYKRSQQIVARIKSEQSLVHVVDKFEQLWNELRPGHPFAFRFASDISEAYYSKEQRLKQILQLASYIGIAIALMGLFSITSLLLSLKKKELGIRKVLGASAWQIGFLVLKRLTSLILVAFAIAIPCSWFIVDNWWLDNFAYRTEVNIGSLMLIGIGAIVTAWLTIGTQTFKAATLNPVNSLNNE